jgi:hypothetical protein
MRQAVSPSVRAHAHAHAHARALALAASLLAAAPAAARGQPANPGVWRPVPQEVADSMSVRALLRLHRRLLAHEDSLIGYGGYLVAHGVPWRARGAAARGPLSAGAYAALVGAALAYNATCPFGRSACERDRGGYVDSFRSMDKLAHATSALALTSLTVQAGVRPRDAALVTLAGSVGFELTQARDGGYYSSRDVLANAAGVSAAWAWTAWVEHRRPRRSGRPTR